MIGILPKGNHSDFGNTLSITLLYDLPRSVAIPNFPFNYSLVVLLLIGQHKRFGAK
jgi:hypothetical protein